MPNREFLRRRNEAWRALRAANEGTPEFERALRELQELVRWPRERILAGLGRPPEDGTGSNEGA